MATDRELAQCLQRMDGAPYPAYKDLRGRYAFPGFELSIDHVQGDPFAAPSRLSIHIGHRESGLEERAYRERARRTGTENFLAVGFAAACEGLRDRSGSGRSGLLAIDRPGQELLRRTCVEIGEEQTVVRIVAGLPANGRRILGRAAATLLTDMVPQAVERALMVRNVDAGLMGQYADVAEDAEQLRGILGEMGLVGFAANGAILPRASGVDQRPLAGAVPFVSPPSMEVEVELPRAGRVRGMGIREGVTLIVGGGFHGKSTLLNALERGIYGHRPGDGRELVVARRDAVKVRAEDGRAVTGVNLTPFINNLPGGQSTEAFTTENASGSTSQAANLMEALEAGSRALLMDEDISATNLLIRDRRMQELVAAEREPITPLVQRVRSLWEDHGVSTVLVLGGSGDYFEVADQVIAMDAYLPRDVTAEARAIAAAHGAESPKPGRLVLPFLRRVPDPASVRPYRDAAPYRGRRRDGGGGDGDRDRGREARPNVRAHDTRSLSFGRDEIDLSLVSQILDASQVRMLGEALVYALERGILDGRRAMVEVAEALVAVMDREGLSAIGTRDLAEVRAQDVAAALNRLRSLRMVGA